MKYKVSFLLKYQNAKKPPSVNVFIQNLGLHVKCQNHNLYIEQPFNCYAITRGISASSTLLVNFNDSNIVSVNANCKHKKT